MEKICERCGKQLRGNDFLCPHCGAIWGDRNYRPPTPSHPVSSAPQKVK